MTPRLLTSRSVGVRLAGPVAGLGALLALACLVGTWSINRLRDDLGRASRADSAALQAAQEAQIQLRRLRFHALMHAADPRPDRLARIAEDRRRFEAALAALRAVGRPDDAGDLDALRAIYDGYVAELAPGAAPTFGTVADLVRWSDDHHVSQLMEPYRDLTDRTRDRMNRTLERSEEQSLWAGRALLAVGVVGPFAGAVAGFAAARGWSRRVAELSVRVRAVEAQLDDEVGAMRFDAEGPDARLDAQLDRVVARVREVCERLQAAERDRLRAEQMAAVGHLAAGVAHEVRNPLTGIKLLAQAAARPHDPAPLVGERLDLVLREIARIERTVAGLMDFARTPPLDLRPLDLRALAAEAAAIAAGRAEAKGVALTVEGAPRPARADRDQMLALLTNLLFNAVDAAPPGGSVGVRVGGGAEGAAVVEVSDDGPGIAPAVAGRLFTPFVTTKPTGTGLGLTVARRAAHLHGGALAAADRPGGGAVFTLTLPRADGTDAESPTG